MGIPLGFVFKSCFIVFPMSFKSSCICPAGTVTNILRNVPSHQHQSSPLRAVPCGATARATGLNGQPQQGLEIIIVIPVSGF